MSLSGGPIDYIAAFLGGLMVSFTPCVYPLIPVSAGFIAAESGNSKLKGLSLSLIYVTGIAITYSILGLAASLTGKLFGFISSYPLTYILVGGVIIFFGLAMLDLFGLSLPGLFKVLPLKRKGYISIFLLGLTSGLVIGPCTTPALAAILVYLTTRQNIVYGMTLLFVFAYGMSVILILVGTFSSLIVSLPRSGRWMIYIKKLCGMIILVGGLYFIFEGIRRLG
ncbi:MAG: sulfite exporter TauE/SafE family protein [Candidatus Omnitrophica bacterium]|nr:sulfite exporter TauE/SafE family protein [Candidatus Omnitrophota bacterium]